MTPITKARKSFDRGFLHAKAAGQLTPQLEFEGEQVRSSFKTFDLNKNSNARDLARRYLSAQLEKFETLLLSRSART